MKIKTMKIKTLLTLTIATTVFFAACGNPSAKKEDSHEGHDHAKHDDHEGHDHGTEDTAAITPEVNDENLNTVFQQYLKLNEALVNSDAAEAKTAASALELGAKELGDDSKIAESAAKIASATTLEEERAAFSTLSNELIEMVKKAGVKSGEIYVDFCPMAFNDTGGYWLSSVEGIRNPYFGDKMMKCGETKETLK